MLCFLCLNELAAEHVIPAKAGIFLYENKIAGQARNNMLPLQHQKG